MHERWMTLRQWAENFPGLRALGANLKHLDVRRQPAPIHPVPMQPQTSPAIRLADPTGQSLGTLFYVSPIAICVSTLEDGRVLTVNDRFLQMTGYSRTDVVGHISDEIGIWTNSHHHANLVELLNKHGSIRDLEAKCCTKQGEIRYALLSAERIDVDGEMNMLLLAHDITKRKRAEEKQEWLFEEVRASRGRLQALSKQLMEVQESERRHITRELHDEIGQMLTGLNFALESAARAPAETVESRLSEAHLLVNELITRVRNLSLGLRPGMLDDLGLLPALLWLTERYTQQTKIHVEFGHSGLDRRFAPEIETAAYRIVQEALTNVARHANENEVSVRLWADEEMLHLQVEDWGVGFDVDAVLATGRSCGLTGMRERAILLGGQLNIESVSGVGTRVDAELPINGYRLERRRDEYNDPARR